MCTLMGNAKTVGIKDHVFTRLKVSDYDTWNYDKNFVYWK